MKLVKVTVFIALSCLALSGGVSAQVCGDANDNGTITIVDLVTIVNFAAGLPSGINLANADCDGIPGVTISDAAVLSAEVFYANGQLDCTVEGTYSLTPTANDSVYIPIVTDIPADVNAVYLLIASFFSTPANAFYVPILENGAGSSNLFQLNTTFGHESIGGGATFLSEPNKRVLWGLETFDQGIFNGRMNLLLLRFDRIYPGVGTIAPEAYDRPTPWLIALARNNDLYKPVISYHTNTYPGGLQLSNRDLHFHALSNQISLDTFSVNIIHSPFDVGFKLYSASQWINFDQSNGVTPATVTFTADASSLCPTDSTGTVYVSYEGFSPFVDSIEITLTVHPAGNLTFPAGDVNCDQALNIIDLNHMVNFFFRGGLRPFPCE